MSVSVFDHPLLSGLLGDDETAALFSVSADIGAMLQFEAGLARSQAAEGAIPAAAATAIETACGTFQPDMIQLRSTTAQDGVVVPGLVRQLRASLSSEHASFLHRGPTSQDLIDTSLVLRLRDVAGIIERRLAEIDALLGEIDRKFGGNRLVARTRMRRALDIRAHDRIAAWRSPLLRGRRRLADIVPSLCVLQMGGPTGTLDPADEAWPRIVERLGVELGLPAPKTSWHSQRDRLVEFASCLSEVTGNLGKIGQDIALMAQDEIAEVELDGGGASSSMPHKSNPIAAETLVALARFNAVQISAMHHAMIHEQERSGSAWTLEWMVLPSICVAAATALRTATTLLTGIRAFGQSPLV